MASYKISCLEMGGITKWPQQTFKDDGCGQYEFSQLGQGYFMGTTMDWGSRINLILTIRNED
jgi:hypothetical protein